MKEFIKEIPNFPKPNISFKDIQPILSDYKKLNHLIEEMISKITIPDFFVGVESRGFIFATALAIHTGKGLKLIRKKGKLPPPILSIDYDLEYGNDTIEMCPGSGDVVIVDDVYATGGTMIAAKKLCQKAGFNVIDEIVAIDLKNLHDNNIKSVVSYE